MADRLLRKSCLALLMLAISLMLSSGGAAAKAPVGVPTSDDARIWLLDTYTGALIWYHTCPGDYNQDGLVNASDITPLGIHFGEAPDSIAWGEWQVQRQIDGDGNGLINVSDLTPIGANFGSDVLGGFNIYAADSLEQYPKTNAGPDPAAARLLGHVGFDETITDRSELDEKRLEFTFQPAELSKPDFYWIRPVDKDGNEGTSSTTIVELGRRAPDSFDSAAIASWDAETDTLSWYYANQGDCNQNGVVEASDISAIGVYFQAQSPGFPSPWPIESEMSMVDCNSNGQIEVSDIAVVNLYFGRRVEGYNVYASTNPADYPASSEADSSLVPLIGGVRFEDYVSHVERTRLYVTIENHAAGAFYWVRPYDYLGYEGTPSNLVATAE